MSLLTYQAWVQEQNSTLAKAMFDSDGQLNTGVRQGDFSSTYTNWLTYVFNSDVVQTWLASQDAYYSAWQLSRTGGANVTLDGGFKVEINQNSTSLPTISYSDGTTTRTIDQSLIAQIFGAKDGVTIQTGSKATQTQERSYVYGFDTIQSEAPTSVSAKEDETFSFTGVNTISVSDGDSANITVSLTVGHGTLTIDLANFGVTVTAGENGSSALTLSGSKAAINAVLKSLQYTGSQDWSGNDNLIIKTSDGLFEDEDVVAIAVTAVNDAPTAASNTVTTLEDTSHTFAVSEFGFSDVKDTGAAGTLTNVIITNLPTQGG